MNKKEINMIEAFFHSYATGFDSIYGNGQKRNVFNKIIDKLFRKSMRLRYEQTLRELDLRKKDLSTVLDIGSGSGRYANDISKMGLHVTGIDIAQGMIDLATSVNKSEIERGEVVFILSDYMNFDVGDRFDVSVLMGLFDYVKEPVKMIKKLKKDSFLILASFPKSGGLLAKQRLVRYKLKKCPLYLYSKKDIQTILEEANITDYQLLEFDREYYLIAKT